MPTNFNDPKVIQDIRRFITYDPHLDSLIWLARTRDDFHTVDPDRTAVGWNRKWAGKPVAVKSTNQVSLRANKRDIIGQENRFREILGAPPSVRSGGSYDPETGEWVQKRTRSGESMTTHEPFLRAVFAVDHRSGAPMIVWAFRTLEVHEAIVEMCRGFDAKARAGRNPSGLEVENLGRFNARYAGKPVRPSTTDRCVYVAGRIRIRWDDLVQALGLRPMAPPRPVLRGPEKPVSDEVIRAVLELTEYGGVEYGGVQWKARDRGVWDLLVREGVVIGRPTDEGIAEWNAKNVGGRPGLARSSVRIHLKTVGIVRAKEVLSRKPAPSVYGF